MDNPRKISTRLTLILAAVFLSACSDPKVTVNFHKAPAAEALDELTEKLSEKGLAIEEMKTTPQGKEISFRTELEKPAFEKAVAEVFEPLAWNPERKSRLEVAITEKDKEVLEILSLKTGQKSDVLVDWNSADDGIYGITRNGNRKRKQYVCAVHAGTEGAIPNLSYGYDLGRNKGGSSELAKTLQRMLAMRSAVAAHEVNLEGFTKEQKPWKEIKFFPPKAKSGNDANNGEALFVFEYCQSDPAYSQYSTAAELTGNSCHLSDYQCKELIRERAGGDFFGVTGRQLKGNVTDYETSW